MHCLAYKEIHRITGQFGSEGIISCQSPCQGQGYLPIDQGAKSPIQSGLAYNSKHVIIKVMEKAKEECPVFTQVLFTYLHGL